MGFASYPWFFFIMFLLSFLLFCFSTFFYFSNSFWDWLHCVCQCHSWLPLGATHWATFPFFFSPIGGYHMELCALYTPGDTGLQTLSWPQCVTVRYLTVRNCYLCCCGGAFRVRRGFKMRWHRSVDIHSLLFYVGSFRSVVKLARFKTPP